MAQNLTVLAGDKLSSQELAESDAMPLDQAITARLKRKVHEFGLAFDLSTGTFVGPRRGAYTVEELATAAWTQKTDWPKGAFHGCASELVRDLRIEAVKRIRNTVLSYGAGRQADAVNELTKFVNLLTHPSSTVEQRTYYLIAWRQLIWQVKRKLRGFPTSWDIMLCLFSKQGTGKSSVAAKFGSPLKQLYLGMADFTLFSDKFRLPQLHSHYLVCLDEMGRANKTDINAIKQLITAETVQSRKMYSQAEIALTRNASFIATTNRPLMASLTDSTGMRRFVEMRCSDTEVTAEWIEAVNALDFALIWAAESGDANAAAPASEYRELFAKHQAAAAMRSDFEYWAEQSLTVTNDEADKVRNAEAYASYKELCESQRHHPISIQLFAREMRERYGAGKAGNAVYFRGLTLTKGGE